MIPVIIESPFAGDVERNKAYLQECIRHAVRNGETPYASHQMLTDALDDLDPAERKLGIDAGLALGDVIVSAGGKHIFYLDLEMSNGMCYALEHAASLGRTVEFRWLSGSLSEYTMAAAFPARYIVDGTPIAKTPLFGAARSHYLKAKIRRDAKKGGEE